MHNTLRKHSDFHTRRDLKDWSVLFSEDMTERGHFRKLEEISSEHTENVKQISSTYCPHISIGKRESSVKQYTS